MSNSNNSSAAGGGGGMVPQNIQQINGLVSELNTVINDINVDSAKNANEIVARLLSANFMQIDRDEAQQLVVELENMQQQINGSQLVEAVELSDLIEKIKRDNPTYSDRVSELGKRARLALSNAEEQGSKRESGLLDMVETNNFLAKLSNDLSEFTKRHKEMTELKRRGLLEQHAKMEREETAKLAAYSAAIDAQQADLKNKYMEGLKCGKYQAEQVFKIGKVAKDTLSEINKKPEQTLVDKAAVIYVKKVESYVEQLKAICPSLKGTALVTAGGISGAGAASAVSSFFRVPAVASAIGTSSALVPVAEAGAVVAAPSTFAAIMANPYVLGTLQTGSIFTFAYLTAVYGPTFAGYLRDVYITIDGIYGDGLNYLLGIVTPTMESISQIAGITMVLPNIMHKM